MRQSKLLPAVVLFLVAAPVVSFADAGRPSSSPCPVATISPPRTPEEQQRAIGARPSDLPTNGRIRTRSYVGPAATVDIVLLENGAPVPFDRVVEGDDVELVPRRSLKANANVTVDVGGIRSAVYRVVPKDDAAPEIIAVRIESVDPRFDSKIACPRSTPGDRILGMATIHDASSIRVRSSVVYGDAVVATTESAYPVPRTSRPSDDRPFAFWFPTGTLKAGAHAVLRLDVVDVAGNAAKTIDVGIDVPPDAEVDAGSSSTPAPAKRGCR